MISLFQVKVLTAKVRERVPAAEMKLATWFYSLSYQSVFLSCYIVFISFLFWVFLFSFSEIFLFLISRSYYFWRFLSISPESFFLYFILLFPSFSFNFFLSIVFFQSFSFNRFLSIFIFHSFSFYLFLFFLVFFVFFLFLSLPSNGKVWMHEPDLASNDCVFVVFFFCLSSNLRPAALRPAGHTELFCTLWQTEGLDEGLDKGLDKGLNKGL